jgi:hypothetical protein
MHPVTGSGLPPRVHPGRHEHPRQRLLPRPLRALTSLAVTALMGATALSWSSVRVEAQGPQELAPGVTYESLDVATPRGTAHAHIVAVDLSHPKVSVNLLYPGDVAARQPISAMANERQAVAGVNGDFFNISNTQPGVTPTNAPVGPAIASLLHLKGAVPTAQRFGPSMPAGATVADVIGVGIDRRGRLGSLTLKGVALSRSARYELRGLNQYAIAQGGIGAFNLAWGTTPRKRATCGTDTRREDPCSTNVHEVTVRRGRVSAVAAEPGEGDIPWDTVVLVGREAGADELRQLQIGDPVVVGYYLESTGHVPFWFAVGGQPIVRDGAAVAGLNNTTAATRSAAGVSADGKQLFLLALDRNAPGMTYAELAALLLSVGAANGVNLDGGGSSTLVARDPGAASVTIKNLAPGDFERPVPNGIGIFAHP